jgi:hypothetical protein
MLKLKDCSYWSPPVKTAIALLVTAALLLAAALKIAALQIALEPQMALEHKMALEPQMQLEPATSCAVEVPLEVVNTDNGDIATWLAGAADCARRDPRLRTTPTTARLLKKMRVPPAALVLLPCLRTVI